MVHIVLSHNHKVYIGNESIAIIDEFIGQPQYNDSKIFILVDENTHQHCLSLLLLNVKRLGRAEIIEIESGEQNKTIEICIQVWETLSELKADRKALFINLGGGVIGDMGGFIAATFKRGIDFINIPTTLLSQVDASVGGKTGIDLNNLKNQIGLFSLPKAVFIIPEFLKTLSREQIRSGFAEIIKHALIFDKNYWEKIKEITSLDLPYLEELIAASVEIKNKVILEDPTEKGLRKILNFGHTIGHAIESHSLEHDSIPLLHGESIAIGMICEAYLSIKKTGLPFSQLQEILALINHHYIHYPLQKSTYDILLDLMANDKKNEQEKINFALLKNIGETVIDAYCNPEEIIEALDFYSNQN